MMACVHQSEVISMAQMRARISNDHKCWVLVLRRMAEVKNAVKIFYILY